VPLRPANATLAASFFFVLDLFKGVIFPARAAIELHATSRARQAYAPSYEADAVTRGSAG
jgi:bacteriorhodopsin